MLQVIHWCPRRGGKTLRQHVRCPQIPICCQNRASGQVRRLKCPSSHPYCVQRWAQSPVCRGKFILNGQLLFLFLFSRRGFDSSRASAAWFPGGLSPIPSHGGYPEPLPGAAREGRESRAGWGAGFCSSARGFFYLPISKEFVFLFSSNFFPKST